MTWFDPIKPYLSTIKLVLGLVLLGFMFVSGCNYKADKTEKQVAEITQSRDYYRSQGDVLAKDLAEVNKQYKANAQAAREWQDRARDAALDAEKEKKKNNAELQKWAEEVDRLKKDPDCKAILEMKLCASITSF